MRGGYLGKSSLFVALAVSSLLLLAAGCNSGNGESAKPAAPASKAATATPSAGPSDGNAVLQETVVAYVRDVKGLDTSKMDVITKDAVVTGDTARATVAYTIKGSGMAPMTYQYAFQKNGEAWKVVSSKPAPGEGHGAMPLQGLPEGHPPVSGQPAGTNAPVMASGHQAPPAPAGH